VISAGIARAYAELAKKHRDLLSAMLLDSIEAGRGISAAALAEAEAARVDGIQAINAFFKDYDAILTPSAAGEAPKGLQSTGQPQFNRLWTFLGTPCVSLPVGVGPNGLPVGLQLVGPRGKDRELLALSDWAFNILGAIAAPSLPKAIQMAALQRRAGLSLDAELAQAWAEGDKVLQDIAAKLPRELSYEVEPAHVFVPSRRRR
jgi:Asp-tRNA(Asn)/Glu-tRNA(Gln) amidotransferase A subunit family amidase